MNNLSVADLVQIRILSETASGAQKDSAGASYVAFIKNVRGDKLMLTLADANEAVSICVGLAVQLQKPMKHGVRLYKSVITFVGTQQPPTIVLRMLSISEQVERRAFDRVPTNAEIRYRHAGDALKWFSARLRNLSATGACLILDENEDRGNQLVLELPFAQDRICVNAVVRWAEKRHTAGTVVGTEFSSVTRMKGFAQNG